MHTNQPLASREEIRAFIEREYPELAGGDISIGLLGKHYRVMVKDAAHGWHTIHAGVALAPGVEAGGIASPTKKRLVKMSQARDFSRARTLIATPRIVAKAARVSREYDMGEEGSRHRAGCRPV
jgi:hypothetical protein